MSAIEDEASFEARKAVAVEVCKAIEARLGAHVVHDWLWECTPYPCGLPSDEQLDEGRALVAGTLTFAELRARCDEQRRVAMEAYREP